MGSRVTVGFYTEGRGRRRKVHPIQAAYDHIQRVRATLEAIRHRPVVPYYIQHRRALPPPPQTGQEAPQKTGILKVLKGGVEYVVSSHVADKEGALRELEALTHAALDLARRRGLEVTPVRATWAADGELGVVFRGVDAEDLGWALREDAPRWGERVLDDVIKFDNGDVLVRYMPRMGRVPAPPPPRGEAAALILKAEDKLLTERGVGEYLKRGWDAESLQVAREAMRKAPSFVFTATRRLSDEEFKEVVRSGIEYANGEFILNPVTVSNLEAALKVVEKYGGEGARRAVEARLPEITEARHALSEAKKRVEEREDAARAAFSHILGAKVESIEVKRDAVGQPIYYVRTERLGSDKFKELASKYAYAAGEFRVLPHQAHPALKELEEKGALAESGKYTKEDLKQASHAWEENERRQEAKRAVVEKIEKKVGAKVERYIDAGKYYDVKLERLGPERFRELARKYNYTMGYFKIPKEEVD